MEEEKSLEDKIFEAIRMSLWNVSISDTKIAAKACLVLTLKEILNILREISIPQEEVPDNGDARYYYETMLVSKMLDIGHQINLLESNPK